MLCISEKNAGRSVWLRKYDAFWRNVELTTAKALLYFAKYSLWAPVSKILDIDTHSATGVMATQSVDCRRVSIFARVRPFLPSDPSHSQYVSDPDSSTIDIGGRHFAFDGVCGPASKQSDVYRTVAAAGITDCLAGRNAVVMSYGQTNSGKTHSLFGPELDGARLTARDASALGIIPRAAHDLFERIGARTERTSGLSYVVSLTYLQLYCDTWVDLLAPLSGSGNAAAAVDRGSWLQGRSAIGKGDAAAASAKPLTPSTSTTHVCDNVRELLKLLHQGQSRRAQAATKLNSHSSRGHTVLCLAVTKRTSTGSDGYATDDQSESSSSSLLTFIDLAGSERLERTAASGKALGEVKFIHKSLSALGQVMAGLGSAAIRGAKRAQGLPSDAAAASAFIPWRASKLTTFLQSCLAGPAAVYGAPAAGSVTAQSSSLTLLLCLSPTLADAKETQSTLIFGARARAAAEALAGDADTAAQLLDDSTYRLHISSTGISRPPDAANNNNFVSRRSRSRAPVQSLQPQRSRALPPPPSSGVSDHPSPTASTAAGSPRRGRFRAPGSSPARGTAKDIANGFHYHDVVAVQSRAASTLLADDNGEFLPRRAAAFVDASAADHDDAYEVEAVIDRQRTLIGSLTLDYEALTSDYDRLASEHAALQQELRRAQRREAEREAERQRAAAAAVSSASYAAQASSQSSPSRVVLSLQSSSAAGGQANRLSSAANDVLSANKLSATDSHRNSSDASGAREGRNSYRGLSTSSLEELAFLPLNNAAGDREIDAALAAFLRRRGATHLPPFPSAGSGSDGAGHSPRAAASRLPSASSPNSADSALSSPTAAAVMPAGASRVDASTSPFSHQQQADSHTDLGYDSHPNDDDYADDHYDVEGQEAEENEEVYGGEVEGASSINSDAFDQEVCDPHWRYNASGTDRSALARHASARSVLSTASASSSLNGHSLAAAQQALSRARAVVGRLGQVTPSQSQSRPSSAQDGATTATSYSSTTAQSRATDMPAHSWLGADSLKWESSHDKAMHSPSSSSSFGPRAQHQQRQRDYTSPPWAGGSHAPSPFSPPSPSSSSFLGYVSPPTPDAPSPSRQRLLGRRQTSPLREAGAGAILSGSSRRDRQLSETLSGTQAALRRAMAALLTAADVRGAAGAVARNHGSH